MDAQKAALEVRLAVGDPQRMKWSDFDMVRVLNDAGRWLFDRLAVRGSSLPVKRATLTFTDCAAALPTDFGSIIRMEGADGTPLFRGEGWEMIGDSVLSEAPTMELLYNRLPKRISALSETMDIPDVLFQSLVAVAAATLSGGASDGLAQAEREAAMIAQRREWGRIPDGRVWR